MDQILALVAPSKKAPGQEGAVVNMEVGLGAVHGPALPHIF